MYKHELHTTQTQEALQLCKHYFGQKPSHITYEEKRLQAEREMTRNFTVRTSRFLQSLGFKISL